MVHFGPSLFHRDYKRFFYNLYGLFSCAQILSPRGTMRVFEIARGPSTQSKMVDDLKQWSRKEISKLLGTDVDQEFSE